MKHLVGVWGAGHAEVAGAVVALMQCSSLTALSQFCESTSVFITSLSTAKLDLNLHEAVYNFS